MELKQGIKKSIIKKSFNIAFIEGISVGKAHVLAWNAHGQLFSWGDSTCGKLGYLVNNLNNY